MVLPTAPPASLSVSQILTEFGIAAGTQKQLSNDLFPLVGGTAGATCSLAASFSGKSQDTSVKFVAFTNDTTETAYSTDGITWTLSTMPTVSGYPNWYSAARNPTTRRIVVIRQNTAQAAYSDNGATWTLVSLPVSAYWQDITCNSSGKFVVTPFNGTDGLYSADGINWTVTSFPITVYSTGTYLGVASSPTTGRFVAVTGGPDDHTAYSDNGISWTAGGTLPSSGEWRDIACSPSGRFVTVKRSSTNGAYSSDGTSWISTTMPTSSQWFSVACSPTTGRFVAISNGTNGAGAYSDNGTSWISMSLPTSAGTTWVSLTCGLNGRFVAIGYTPSRAAYSDNGISWNISTISASTNTWLTVTNR